MRQKRLSGPIEHPLNELAHHGADHLFLWLRRNIYESALVLMLPEIALLLRMFIMVMTVVKVDGPNTSVERSSRFPAGATAPCKPWMPAISFSTRRNRVGGCHTTRSTSLNTVRR